jgi:magnesium chelatase ATPase subunit I
MLACPHPAFQLKGLHSRMNNRNANSHKTPKKRNAYQVKSGKDAAYPFAAIVGQGEMKLALTLNVIDPSVGGVLIMGHRGTAKSTAVRALADLLPEMSVVSMCPYQCDPADEAHLCSECKETISSETTLRHEKRAVPVVELPLGATEDRVCGTIDIERALGSGVKSFEPGLLARANRGFLYIDEVNLLEDHLVDLLLDVAVTGVNKVERESISIEHPARFVLIGSGNPEEGELRPQLLDRFGLYVEVKTEGELGRRVEIVERRNAFESDREAFRRTFAAEQDGLRKRITRARKALGNVKVERPVLMRIAELCSNLNVDGHRGELTITRAARALAAFEGRKQISDVEVKRVVVMSLRHRLRRDALEEAGTADRIEHALEKIFAEANGSAGASRGGSGEGEGEGSSFPPEVARDKGRQRSQNSSRARGQSASPEADAGTSGKTKTTPVPLVDSNLPKLNFAKNAPREIKQTKSRFQSSRQTSLMKGIYNHERGRYARAVSARNRSSRVAPDATLRALISSTSERPTSRSSPVPSPGTRQMTPIPSEALRFKLFKRKQGRLFIFAIDLSGSMALNRIAQAKETMLGLLHQSYVKRDSVAIVGFRGVSAQLLLPPSRSILRARRVLDSLGIGGGTPLSAGLACALHLSKRAQAQAGELTLLLFTDGHANVPIAANGNTDRQYRRQVIRSEVNLLGAALKKAGVKIVLIATQNRFTANDEAYALARTLAAEYRTLPLIAANSTAAGGSYDLT